MGIIMNKDPINLEEQISNIDFLLPMKIFNNTLKFGDRSLDVHWHNELEFVIILEGRGYYFINGETLEVEKNDIIIINPGQLHSGFAFENTIIENTNIILKYNLVVSYAIDACQYKYINPLIDEKLRLPSILKNNNIIYKDLYRLLKELEKEYKNKKIGYELKIKAILFNILYLFFSNKLVVKDNLSIDTSHISNIKTIINLIQENYSTEITLSMLSEYVSISQYHLCRIFKKHTGQTITQYINNYRIGIAGKLLTQTDKSITDIALEVGFNNISYFNSRFKKKWLKTPSQYREFFE